MGFPRDQRGRQVISTEKPDGTKATLYSHDWSDKTTWYEGSVRVVDEVATNSGDNLTYTLANQFVIDTYHAKLTQEDFLVDASSNSYRAVVKVNDVAKTEQDPHVGSGGDYTINYAAGSVTFLSALNPSDVVKVTYHYATNSIFTVKPTAGKRLTLDFVEVQFSTDVVITDSVRFQPRGYVDAFAPTYVGYLGNSATFTNGSTTVTGSGFTALNLAGKYIRSSAHTTYENMLVASVESDTSLTLASAYTGANSTAALFWSNYATGTYPTGTLIPLGNPLVYKSMRDFMNDAVRSYVKYPAMGGTGWRGMNFETLVLDWDYTRATPLLSSAGMEIQIFLEHDVAFTGSYATATLYCASEDETS